MLRLVILSLLACSNAVLGLPAASSSYQLRTVTDPIYHLYLQALPTNSSRPVLGPQASGDNYTIATTIQSTTKGVYLNIADATTSYKPLYFSSTAKTTAWGLEGDTIITTQGSSYGRQLNFLACQASGGYWDLYFQTGSDQPSSGTCSNYQTLHLPCLC